MSEPSTNIQVPLLPARGNRLRPGGKYLYVPSFGEGPQEVQFVRRIPCQPGRAAINQFIVPMFAGLNGPDDMGLTEFTDVGVRRAIRIIPAEAGR